MKNKFDTAIKVLAGLFVASFFLPFFSITCQGMEVANVTGFAMVHGGEAGGLIAEKKNEGKSDGKPAPSTKVKVEPFAIAGFVLGLIGFGVSFVRGRQMRIVNMAVAGVSLAALIGLYIGVQGNADELKEAASPSKQLSKAKPAGPDGDMMQSGGKIASQIEKDLKIEIGPTVGFMAACLFALLIGVLGWKSMNAPPVAAAGAPPMATGPPPGMGGMPPGGMPPGGMPPGGMPPGGMPPGGMPPNA